MLDDLIENGGSADFEMGRATTFIGGEYQHYDIDGEYGDPFIDAWPGLYPNDMTSYIHTHYGGLMNVFSIDDLLVPFMWYADGKIFDIESFSFGLVAPDGGIYYLFVSDKDKFERNFIWPPDILKRKVVGLYNDYGIKNDTSGPLAVQGLSHVVEDLGMTLMKGNASGGGFARMEPNINGEKAKEIPC